MLKCKILVLFSVKHDLYDPILQCSNIFVSMYLRGNPPVDRVTSAQKLCTCNIVYILQCITNFYVTVLIFSQKKLFLTTPNFQNKC